MPNNMGLFCTIWLISNSESFPSKQFLKNGTLAPYNVYCMYNANYFFTCNTGNIQKQNWILCHFIFGPLQKKVFFRSSFSFLFIKSSDYTKLVFSNLITPDYTFLTQALNSANSNVRLFKKKNSFVPRFPYFVPGFIDFMYV